jgi:hypothetical protein
MATMNLRKSLCLAANDLLQTMKKSFGHIVDPEYPFKEKYDHFPEYTLEDVYDRLMEGVEMSYLTAVLEPDFVHMFIENNGFRYLLGDPIQYSELKSWEQKKWYLLAKSIASFLSIISATGKQLSGYEDFAKLAQSTMKANVGKQSPFDSLTSLFRNPEMRKMMLNVIPDASSMASLISKSEPLMDCMGSKNIENLELPDVVEITDVEKEQHRMKMLALKEESEKKEEEKCLGSTAVPQSDPTTLESALVNTPNIPRSSNEEGIFEEENSKLSNSTATDKASDLMKDLFASVGGAKGKSNPMSSKDTMKKLAKALSTFTQNPEEMEKLHSSVTGALSSNKGDMFDLASITKNLRKQVGNANPAAKNVEDFLFNIPKVTENITVEPYKEEETKTELKPLNVPFAQQAMEELNRADTETQTYHEPNEPMMDDAISGLSQMFGGIDIRSLINQPFIKEMIVQQQQQQSNLSNQNSQTVEVPVCIQEIEPTVPKLDLLSDQELERVD